MIFKTKEGYSIRRIGRKKKIYCNYLDKYYFVWHDVRYYLDDIIRLSYPVFFEHDEKLDYCCGYIGISNCYGVMVSIDDCGEYVEIYEEIESEE